MNRSAIRLSPTLFGYIAKQFTMSFVMVYGTMLSVAFIFDTVELTRRLAKKSEIDFNLILQMGAYKLPEVGQELFAFAVLFSSILAFWRLTRSNELVIVRAAGLSAWQFLFPAITTAFLIGLVKIMLINPAGAIMIGKYEQLEASHLKVQGRIVNLSSTGLWLKQPTNSGNIIIHAHNIDEKSWVLHNVNLFFINSEAAVTNRMDAQTAELEKDMWLLKDVSVNTIGENVLPPEKKETIHIPTNITRSELEDSFASPETISFWELPGYIRMMENAGLSSSKIKMHYYKLLSEPLLFIALVLLAASLSLRPPRQMNNMLMVGGSLGIAFLVFFLGDVLRAFGISDALPIVAAAWAPAIISFLIGLTALLYLEDG